MKTGIEKTRNACLRKTLSRDMKLNGSLYLLMLPVLAYFVIFYYVPMYGAVIAFKDFSQIL